MNKRIQELLLRAGFTNAYNDPNEGFELVFVDEGHTTESAEKFAELIVRECLKLQHKNVVVGSVSGYNRGRREFAEDIKKHFGVE